MGKEGAVHQHFYKIGSYHAGAAEKEGVDPAEPSGCFPDDQKCHKNKKPKESNKVMMTMVVSDKTLLSGQFLRGMGIVVVFNCFLRNIHRKSPSIVM